MDYTEKTKEELIAELLILKEEIKGFKRHLNNLEIKLLESNLNAREVMEASNDVIMLLNKDGLIIDTNEIHAKRLTLTRNDLIGKDIFQFLPEELAQNRYFYFKQVIESGKPSFFEDFRAGYWNEISCYPIFDESKRVDKVVIYAKNITERKEIENKNERTQKLLEESQRIGKIGGWEINIDTMELNWTKEMYSIHEVDSTFNLTVDKRSNFYTPESLVIIDKAVQRAIEYGESYDIDVEINTAKGNRKSIRTTGQADLQNRRNFGYFQDITERKQSEQALKESEEKFRLLFEQSPEAITITNKRGEYIDCNTEALKDMNISSLAELQNYVSTDFYANIDDRDLLVSELTKKGFVQNIELKLKSPKRVEIYDYLISAEIMQLQNCEPLFIVWCRNITERKLAEQAIKESEEKYKFIVDNAIEGMYRTSIDGKALMVNPALANTLGYASTEEYLREMNDSAHQVWVNPEQRAEYISLLDKQEIIQGYECQMKKKDGTPIWVSLNAKIVRDEAGNKIYSEGFSEEITIRKKVELELKEAKEKAERNENYFRRIIATVPSMIYDYVLYPDGRNEFLFVSENCKEILEIKAIDLMADMNLFWNLVHDDDLQKLKQDDIEANKTGKVFYSEVRITTPTGKHKWIELCSRPNTSTNEQPAIWSGYMLDITSRKLAEQVLKESEEKYKESQIIGNIAHWQYDFFSDKLYWSDQLYKIYGVSKDSFEPDLKKALAASHIDDQEKIRTTYFEAIQNKSDFDIESRIITPNGDIKYLITRAKCKFNENGNPISMLGTVADITERKKAEEELKIMNEKLKELNSTKDKFFSIIAHDLRSPFNGILGFSSMLSKEARNLDIDSIVKYSEILNTSALHTFNLLENLLEWAKSQQDGFHYEPKNLLFNNLIIKEINDLEFYIKQKNIRLNNQTSDDMIVTADEKMLSSILRNLISNAIKFTSKDGEISIYTIRKNGYFEVKITDTGIGMTEETIEKLFKIETSFSTRGTEMEKGTGLGLLICKEFIEKHGGKIFVYSKIGIGSEFIFTLPIQN